MGLYTQEGHPTKKLFLTDEEYKRAMQSVVKFCHDLLVVGPGATFYLPCRQPNKPQPGVWFLGGAVKMYTPIRDSLVQTIERETKIRFDAERFAWVRQNRYFFNGQDAGGMPHDAVCEIFVIRLSPEEIEQIKLDPNEYKSGSLKAYNRKALTEIEDPFARTIFLGLWDEIFGPVS